MSRVSARPRPERERVLSPVRQTCPACGGHLRIRYENRRTLVTLSGPMRLRLKIRRCETAGCARHHRPWRPEAGPIGNSPAPMSTDRLNTAPTMLECGVFAR